MKQKNVFISIFLLALASASGLYAQITVNAGTTYQTISGFGAASALNAYQVFNNIATIQNTLWADDSSQPPASQVNGNVGLSILRIAIDDSTTTGNWDTGKEVSVAVDALKVNPNLRIFASEWSPPAAWKNNNNKNGNNTGNDNANPGSNTNQINHANWAAYATYQTNFVKACKTTYGFTPYAISVQNEPDYDTSYDSCLWAPSDFDTYIKTYLGPDLNTAGFNPIIMMPESFADNLNLSATTMGDAGAATFVKAIGMHLYGGGPNTVPASYSTTAGHTVESWETEISDFAANDSSMTSGLKYANQVHNCLVNYNFNAYNYWWILNINTDNEGLYGASNSTTATKRLYCLGNFSKFIRPGFVRISAGGTAPSGVSVSAYYNSTAGKVVVVAINNNGSATNLPVTFSGLTVSTVYPWITDSSRNLVQQASVAVSGGGFTYSLPSQSVVSFVGATSISSTNTFTPTSSATSTPTRTATSTFSPTASNTVTSTLTKTSTPTNSLTATPSSTPTATRTNTPINTATSTATTTATATRTNTPVNTTTNTATPTFTPSSTATKTNSPSNTPTLTATNSPINTSTSTPSNTAVNTGTSTATNSATATKTASPSATPSSTATSTSSSTRTSTPTVTMSPTDTALITPTPTSTATVTSTSSNTATSSMTSSPTATASKTASSTASATRTNTLPDTPSQTATPSSTFTNTLSSTPSSTKSFTSTVTSTSTDTAVITSTVTSSPSFTGTPSPTKTNSPTSTSTSSFTSTASATGTSTSSNTSTSTGTPTSTPTGTVPPTSTSTNTFSSTPSPTHTSSPTPSFTFTTTSTATSTSTHTSTPTPTFTNTPVNTPTSTNSFTFTPTHTLTFTSTPSSTSTHTFSVTATPTKTFTATATSVGNNTVVVYPNPVTGPTVNVLPPAYQGQASVRIEIFTAAFRKVLDETVSNVFGGVTVQMELKDNWGRPLANGLYYVVVTVNGHRSITKLLILH